MQHQRSLQFITKLYREAVENKFYKSLLKHYKKFINISMFYLTCAEIKQIMLESFDVDSEKLNFIQSMTKVWIKENDSEDLLTLFYAVKIERSRDLLCEFRYGDKPNIKKQFIIICSIFDDDDNVLDEKENCFWENAKVLSNFCKKIEVKINKEIISQINRDLLDDTYQLCRKILASSKPGKT